MLDLHPGDRFRPDHYDVDLTVIRIDDHSADALHCAVTEAIDAEGYMWFVIEGQAVRGERR